MNTARFLALVYITHIHIEQVSLKESESFFKIETFNMPLKTNKI